VDAAFEGAPAVDLVAQTGGSLADALGVMRIVPESRIGDLLIERG